MRNIFFRWGQSRRIGSQQRLVVSIPQRSRRWRERVVERGTWFQNDTPNGYSQRKLPYRWQSPCVQSIPLVFGSHWNIPEIFWICWFWRPDGANQLDLASRKRLLSNGWFNSSGSTQEMVQVCSNILKWLLLGITRNQPKNGFLMASSTRGFLKFLPNTEWFFKVSQRLRYSTTLLWNPQMFPKFSEW